MTETDLVDLIRDALVQDLAWHGYFPAGHRDVERARAAGRRAGRQLHRSVRTFISDAGESQVRVSVHDITRPDSGDELGQRRLRARLRRAIEAAQ